MLAIPLYALDVARVTGYRPRADTPVLLQLLFLERKGLREIPQVSYLMFYQSCQSTFYRLQIDEY